MTTTQSDVAIAQSFAVIPFLRYRDTTAAARWLAAALGFTVKELYPSADDVQHGELRFGNDGLIMIGPQKDDALALRSPRELGGSNQGIALVVDDPDSRFAGARERGAEIVRPIADQPYGSRDFTCRDPEGHLWTVGTYRPQGAASLTPYVHYADARAAIEWLGRAFGLEAGLVVPGDGDRVVHAELLCRGPHATGMVMLGNDGGANDLGMASAPRLGGITQGIYVPVADADAHHRRAVAAGASVVRPPEDMPYGSREYGCRDLEGNLWSFGTYLA